MKNQLFATAVATLVTPAILSSTLLLTTQNVMADSVELTDDGGLQLSITANRRAQAIDKTLASVTVITREDIKKIQAHDIVDVLRLQHGISISRNGGSGSSTSVFIRGSESDQVLVIMDGVRVSSATTGAFNWGNISLAQIERVEIVRGPRAALYGSDAIGGVIEITTRKDFTPYISLGYGKYATKQLSAGFSGDIGKNQVSINISGEKSDGFSATNEKAQYTFNADKDPHDKKGVSLSLSRQFNDRIKAGIKLTKHKNKVDYDQGDTDSNLETVSIYMNSEISERWRHEVRASQTKNDLLSTSFYGKSRFNTRRKELNVQHNYSVSNNTSFIIGGNYREDRGISNNYDKKLDNKALYGNINNRNGALNLDLSIRYDKHSKAGSKTTGQVAAGYELSPNTTAYASYGTAFKAPNINELYYPGFFGSYAGNPNLKPETSKTFEAGIKTQLSKNQRLETSLFKTDVKNLISYTGVNQQAINNNNVKIKGLEIGYAANFGKLDLGLDVSLLKARDDNNKQLIRRPKSKVTLNLGYAISDKTRLGLDASIVSSRLDRRDKTLDKYALVNLSLNQKVSKNTDIGLRLENVTNEDYELAYGYNTPKRGAYLTLTYSPK
jgi:vitamin B12 transporter